jgi:hypothetical protein
MIVRMEHTEGHGGLAEVWLDGALLSVCDLLSPPGGKLSPGPIEDVAFRTTADEPVDWSRAARRNPSHRVTLEPIRHWSYMGFGRIVQVMPVVVHFGQLQLEDPNWSTAEELVGQYVALPIDRLEIVPATVPPEL